MDFLFSFLPWFCLLRSHEGSASRPAGFEPEGEWDALAFATVAAAAFFVFALIGLIRNFDAAHGPGVRGGGTGRPGRRAVASTGNGDMATAVGERALLAMAIGFGTAAAFLVAIAAVIVDLLQVNAQTAVLVGVTWQVVYAKLVAQMTAQAEGIHLQNPVAAGGQKPVDETEEP